MTDDTPTAAPSGKTVYPHALQERDWWVNWVLALPFDDTGEPDPEGTPTKQPAAPYDTGHARPVLWNSGLSDDEHPTTNFERPMNWAGVEIGTDITASGRVISDELGVGIIIPVGGGEGEQITLIDWDDVRRPDTGAVHPVCADALRRLDGFAEISQSGEGIHQFVFGEIPGGLLKFIRHIDDEPFVGDGLPQVEMYMSGRVTAMTGRHVEGCGEDVVDGQGLIDDLCWTFGTADNAGPDTPTDPFAADRDGAPEYDDTPDHETVGDSLREAVEYDGDDPAGWDIPDDEPLAYHAVLRAREREPELVNTANWELYGYAAALAYEHDISKAQLIADLREHDRDGYEFDEQKARGEIRKVWRKAKNGNYGPPSKATLAERGILPERYAYDSTDTPIIETDSGLDIRRQSRDGDVYREQLTNFRLDVDAVLEREQSSEFLLTVDPCDSPAVQVAVEPKVFNDTRQFEQKVCGASLSATFDGSGTDLNRIKEYIAQQDAPRRQAVSHIGLHGDEWVTPDGSLTAGGWTDDPEAVFESQSTPLANKIALSPTDGIEYDTDTVRDILRLLPQCRVTERFLPALGWFYAAATRPYIQDWTGEFNILGVTGDTGAGKTATMELLWSCFGVDGDLLRADGTAFPKMRALATSNAVPVIFDEYKPADMSNYTVDQLHSYLRTSTRGGIEEKGQADGSVVGHELVAPAAIVGEQALRGTAEERRTLQTRFSREATVGGTDESMAFTRLTGGSIDGEAVRGVDVTDHALAFYRWLLNTPEPNLRSMWLDAREAAHEAVERMSGDSIDDMRVQAVQTVIYGCRLYRRFAGHVGLPDPPIDETDITDAVRYVLTERTATEHVSNLDRFLALAGRAAAADGYLVEGEQYTVVSAGEPDEELRLKLSLAFDKVRRYARDHDVQDADLLDSATDYRARIRDAVDDPDSYIAGASVQTRGLNRCVAIKTRQAADEINGFERTLFAGAGRDTSDAGAGADGNSLDVRALEPSMGEVTVTATVASVLDPPPWLQGQGVLEDASGIIKYAVKGSSNPMADIDEGDEVEIRRGLVTTNEEGAVVLECVGGVTEVAPAGADASAGADGSTATDGGAAPVNKRVDEHLQELAAGETITAAELAGELGADPSTVEHRIDTVVTERRIIEHIGGGEYRRL